MGTNTKNKFKNKDRKYIKNMGNCCGSCCRCKKLKKFSGPVSILLLGMDGAGKTDIGYFLCKKPRIDFSQTNGSQIYHFKVKDTPINLNEIGGSADIRSLWIHYYREALGAIFVIDSSDFDSFTIARSLLAEVYHNKYMSGKPILIVANKQDSANFVDIIDISTVFSIEKLANKTRTPTLICASGKNQRNELIDGVEWMTKLILDNIKIINNRIKFFDTIASSRFNERTIDRPRTSRERRILKENMQLERPQSAPSQIKVGTTYLVNILPQTPLMRKPPDELNMDNLESIEIVDCS